MGKDLIAELKARAEKATQGEWITEVPPEYDFDDDATFITTEARLENSKVQIAKVEMTFPYDEEPNEFNLEQRANADFITAASPQAVLALIAKVERLEAIVNGYKVSSEEAQEIMGELQAENERLEKEADFLAARLDAECPLDAVGEAAEDTCAKDKCKNDIAGCWRAYARKAVAEQEGKDAEKL